MSPSTLYIVNAQHLAIFITTYLFSYTFFTGGLITKEDLANYTALVEEPLYLRLDDGRVVYSPGPPSSGAVYSFILNILSGP